MAKLSKDQIVQAIEGRPEGTSPEGIIAALRESGHELEAYPVRQHLRQRTPAEHRRRRMEIQAAAQKEAAGADQLRAQSTMGLLEAIPQATGAIGGLVAGTPGATIGGMVGAIPAQTAQVLSGDKTVREGMMGVGTTGVTQGALSAAGTAITAPLRHVGRALSGKAIKAAAVQTRQLYAEATKAGKTYHPLGLTQGLPELVQELMESGVDPKSLQKIVTTYMKTKGGKMTPLQVQEAKQAADRIAEPIFKRAADKKLPLPPVGEQVRGRFFKLVGDNARTMLRQIKGSEELEAATKKEIERNQFYLKVGRRLAAPVVGGAVGAALPAGSGAQRAAQTTLGAAAGAGLANPSALSALGAGISNPNLLAILQQLPRAGATVLQ